MGPDTRRGRPATGAPHELIHSPPASLADPDDTDLLAESDRRDRDLALRHAYFTWGFDACLDYLADLIGGRVTSARPCSQQAWGPGGRTRYGDPRPGDYPGRDGAA
jgi:hypothetical protein